MKKSIVSLIVVFGIMNIANAMDFNQYPVSIYTGKKAPINYKSYPDAKMFKTRINEAYNAKKPDFAGKYSVAVWGCGTSCVVYTMIDRRDGKIYPLSELAFEASDTGKLSCEDVADFMVTVSELLYQANSRLLISKTYCTTNDDEQAIYLNKYLLWNDKTKQFSLIDENFSKEKE